MPDVIARDRPFGAEVRGVLEVRRAHGDVGIVHRLAERIRALEGEALLEVPAELNGAALVVRLRRRRHHVDLPEAGVEAGELAIDEVAGIAVDVVGVIEVASGAAEIVEIGHDAETDFALHTEEPVVRMRVAQVADRRS